MDNAKIHMYSELQRAMESKGVLLVFLPSYSPQLNPIEVGFANVKAWIKKNTHLVFRETREESLHLAFSQCTNAEGMAINLYSHCGYQRNSLRDSMFL